MKKRYTTKEEYLTQRVLLRSRGVPLGRDDFCENDCPDDDQLLDESLHDSFEEWFSTMEQYIRTSIRFQERQNKDKLKEYR